MSTTPTQSIEKQFMVLLDADEPHEFVGVRVHQHVYTADMSLEKGVNCEEECTIIVLDRDDIKLLQEVMDQGLIPRIE